MDVSQALTASPFSKDYPLTVLLIDDQAIVGESVGKMLSDQDDIVFHFCSDPSKAIAEAEKICPTVILQDLVMPEIDGLTLLRYFRVASATKDVPMIVLSSKEDPEVKAQAFALGANDYIVKLPDKVELLARIRYHSTAYISQLQRDEAYEKLAVSQKVLVNELSEAADYVTSLLPKPLDGDVTADWNFIPSTQLGGDTFGYYWLDEDHFISYLVDVCGHGIGAALLSISVIDAINSRTLPDTDFKEPAEVLASLNKHYPMELHHNKFFTMWYGVYNKKTRILKYSSGGHPPMLLFNGDKAENAVLMELKTPGVSIGAMEDMEYVSQSCKIDTYGEMYLFSDGVFELETSDGKIYNIYDFLEMLKEHHLKYNLDDILAWARKVRGISNFDDDYSLVKFLFK